MCIQNYTRCFNFELPSCCLCDDIDHILSVWRDVAGTVTLHGLIDQSSNSVAKLWVLKGVPAKKTPCLPRCQLCWNGFYLQHHALNRRTKEVLDGGGRDWRKYSDKSLWSFILLRIWKIQSLISSWTWAWQHSGRGWGELSFSAEQTVSKQSGGPQRSRWLPSIQLK